MTKEYYSSTGLFSYILICMCLAKQEFRLEQPGTLIDHLVSATVGRKRNLWENIVYRICIELRRISRKDEKDAVTLQKILAFWRQAGEGTPSGTKAGGRRDPASISEVIFRNVSALPTFLVEEVADSGSAESTASGDLLLWPWGKICNFVLVM